MWQAIAALVLAIPISLFLVQVLIFLASFLVSLAGMFGLTAYYKNRKGKKTRD